MNFYLAHYERMSRGYWSFSLLGIEYYDFKYRHSKNTGHSMLSILRGLFAFKRESHPFEDDISFSIFWFYFRIINKHKVWVESRFSDFESNKE